MRILASNPDTIGDMVLRQPMYRALQEAGHELTLIVRPSVAPLVEYIAPGAATILLPAEVYRDDLAEQWPLFDAVFQAARDARPEALLVAPFQWTQFEEQLACELKEAQPPIRRFGMSGRLYAGDPHAGHARASRMTFDVTVSVDEDQPEVEKNAALAAAVLGQADNFTNRPRIEPGDAVLQDAREILEQLGLRPGGYWIACVTGTTHVPIKAWQQENWASLLEQWARRYDRRFLFVGLPEERHVVDEVRRMMGDAANLTQVWISETSSPSHLIGLTAHSAGYAGHDTGPMHIAAALGKPILAVFGGGHKLRFAPRGAAPSVIVTVGVACSGCAWTCLFKTSHCVKDVPVEEVIRAADDLEAGRITGCQPRVLAPTDDLKDRLIREAAVFAREQLRDSGDRSRQLREQDVRIIQPLQSALDQRCREIEALSSKVHDLEGISSGLERTVKRFTGEAAEISAKLHETEAKANRLDAALTFQTREADELRRAVTARDADGHRLREKVRELELAVASRTTNIPSAARRRSFIPKLSAPWRQFLSDLVTGQRHYVPRRTPRPLPKIALVMPIPIDLACGCTDCNTVATAAGGLSPDSARRAPCCSDIAAFRQTIESVLRQEYPRLDYIMAPVGPDDASHPASSWLRPYANRLVWIEKAAAEPFAAIARALELTDADVLGWLEPGDVLEPGALQNVGEYFRDHPRSAGAVFDDTTEIGGWRVTLPRPRLDVPTLVAEARSGEPRSFSVFMRRRAYFALGRLHQSRGRASGWDLWVRFSRRNGFARPGTHVACRRQRPDGVLRPLPLWCAPGQASADAAAAWRADIGIARQVFESRLGFAGRIRARWFNLRLRLEDSLRHFGGSDRLVFPLKNGALNEEASAHQGESATLIPSTGTPGEGEEASAEVATTSSPINQSSAIALSKAMDYEAQPTARTPARLVFGLPADGGFRRLVYHDRAEDVAYAVSVRSDPGAASDSRLGRPFAKHRPAFLWERALLNQPCPWRQRSSENAFARTAERLLSVLAGFADSQKQDISFLHAGCGDGEFLEHLRPAARWTLQGTERDVQLAGAARGKGYAVWETDIVDAPRILPVGCWFDIVFLDTRAPGTDDVLTTLRRVRQLLKADGSIVLTGPNLDSRLLDLYGPDWPHWQVDRALTIPGRSGLTKLARQADLRLKRVRTHTDVSSDTGGLRQQQLSAWAGVLWDWRGKGDCFYAVLQS